MLAVDKGEETRGAQEGAGDVLRDSGVTLQHPQAHEGGSDTDNGQGTTEELSGLILREKPGKEATPTGTDVLEPGWHNKEQLEDRINTEPAVEDVEADSCHVQGYRKDIGQVHQVQ